MKNKGRDELEAEVARLREELTVRSRRCDTWAADLAAERAAREATKAELRRALNIRTGIDAPDANDRQAAVAWMKRAEAAEARVAELERQRDDARRRYYTEAQTRIACDAALNQARGLLERCQYAVPSVLTELLDAVSGWLRAHPAKGNG